MVRVAVDDLPAHGDGVDLSPAQARELADALTETAERVDAARGDDGD